MSAPYNISGAYNGHFSAITIETIAVPEPTGLAVAGLGAALLVRRKLR